MTISSEELLTLKYLLEKGEILRCCHEATAGLSVVDMAGFGVSGTQPRWLECEEIIELVQVLGQMEQDGVSTTHPDYKTLEAMVEYHRNGLVQRATDELSIASNAAVLNNQLHAYKRLAANLAVPTRFLIEMEKLGGGAVTIEEYAKLPAEVVEDVITLREARITRMKERMDARKRSLEAITAEDEKHEKAIRTEKLKLQLLEQQRALRLRFCVDHQQVTMPGVMGPDLKKVVYEKNNASLEYGKIRGHHVSAEKEKQRIEQRRRAKHAEFLRSVIRHQQEFSRHHQKNRAKRAKVVQGVNSYFIELQRQERIRAKARLRALKTNDFDEYRKWVTQSRNKRLMALLGKTDGYMNQLAKMVKEEQAKAAKEKEAEEKAQADKENENKENGEVIDDKEGEKPDGGKDADDGEATLEKAKEKEEEFEGKSKELYELVHSHSEIIEKQPKMMGGGNEDMIMKEYQMTGLQWLVSLYNNRLNGILADEMGLGKTIQTISLLCHLIESGKNNGPFLVIVPLATIPGWTIEFNRWAPDINLAVYKGRPEDREATFYQQIKSKKIHVCLTTYNFPMMKKDERLLRQIEWQYIIIDEGHRLKNKDSLLFQTLTKSYKSKCRLILTGTPLQNSLTELWSLLNFLLPNVFKTSETFEDWFAAPFMGTGEDMELDEEEKLLIINRLHQVLRPFLLRRIKSDIPELQLPDKKEVVVKTELSALQKTLYKQIQNRALSGVDPNTGKGMKPLNNTLMQLRKVCNHPLLFDSMQSLEHEYRFLIRSCGKFELLSRILPKMKAAGHRVLIFSQMVEVLHLLEEFCEMYKYEFRRIDGGVAGEERGQMMAEFNEAESSIFIFLLSTRSGGLGINLQTADTVIIFDSDWNPQMDKQAQARAHRIGQRSDVLVLRFISPNTVEENLLQRANSKLEMEDLAIEAGQFNNKTNSHQSRQVLQNKLALISSEVDDPDVGNEIPTDKTLNKLMARSDEEFDMFQKMDEETEMAVLKEWRENGNKGKPPPRLIDKKEVPEWLTQNSVKVGDFVAIGDRKNYREEELGGVVGRVKKELDGGSMFEVELNDGRRMEVALNELTRIEEDQAGNFGRGQRDRKRTQREGVVNYDGLTDHQYIKMVEAGMELEDIQAEAARRRKAREDAAALATGNTAGGGSAKKPPRPPSRNGPDSLPPPPEMTPNAKRTRTSSRGRVSDDEDQEQQVEEEMETPSKKAKTMPTPESVRSQRSGSRSRR